MPCAVEKIDHDDPAVRERLLAHLGPDEVHALFLVGNLLRGFPDSHLYAARRGTAWAGVAGYYGRPKSLVPYAADAEAARALARHVAERHPDIRYLNAMAATAEPAADELARLGYRVAGDPRQVFMQREGEPPPQPHEDLARPIAPPDAEATARLVRHIRGRPQEDPLTEEELEGIRLNPLRHVLVVGGEVVSTASTNGMGLAAFQILGVATRPDHRGKGYAGAVCASLMRAMGAQGARQTVIFTGLENIPARRCYERLGFRATGAFWVARLERG